MKALAATTTIVITILALMAITLPSDESMKYDISKQVTGSGIFVTLLPDQVLRIENHHIYKTAYLITGDRVAVGVFGTTIITK